MTPLDKTSTVGKGENQGPVRVNLRLNWGLPAQNPVQT